jgi:mono/diheme cytochrome c family protein
MSAFESAFRTLRVVTPALALPALTGTAGGWAVITVDDLPEYAEVGKPIELSFTVRQHGFKPLTGLRPSIEATFGQQTATATIWQADHPGVYAARLRMPSQGDWSITIHSGFMNSQVTLLPIPVVAPGARLTRASAGADRGRRLFIAKGCVTCHEQLTVGPPLTGKRFDAAYIAGFLANPPATPSQAGRSAMPNLGLEQREIASLVAYLNSDRRTVSR